MLKGFLYRIIKMKTIWFKSELITLTKKRSTDGNAAMIEYQNYIIIPYLPIYC